jgi:hypothetical protein
MKNFKLYLTLTIGIMLLLLFIPIIFYVGTFSHSQISTTPSEWGTFGDYIGGLLNPIIGLCNIAVLIFISYYVAKWENDRHKNEFIYKAYLNLADKLDSISLDDLSVDKLKDLHRFNKSFTFNQQFLFQGELNTIFQQRMGELSASITTIRIELEAEEKISKKSITVELDEELAGKLVEAFRESFRDSDLKRVYSSYELDKQLVLGFIQTVLDNGNYKTYRTANIKELKESISA